MFQPSHETRWSLCSRGAQQCHYFGFHKLGGVFFTCFSVGGTKRFEGVWLPFYGVRRTNASWSCTSFTARGGC